MALSELRYNLEVWWLKLRKWLRVGLFGASLAGFVAGVSVIMFGPIADVPVQSMTVAGVYISASMVFLFGSLLLALVSVWLAKSIS